ncbi:hypothetical protein [Streptomyces sp. NPDC001348]
MTDNSGHRPGEGTAPVPRDLPDQQAYPDEDPWAAAAGRGDDEGAANDVPDTDEAGTGRQDAPRPGPEQTEHPVPDEPTG